MLGLAKAMYPHMADLILAMGLQVPYCWDGCPLAWAAIGSMLQGCVAVMVLAHVQAMVGVLFFAGVCSMRYVVVLHLAPLAPKTSEHPMQTVG